jgi:flagellar protein FliO/FliZ
LFLSPTLALAAEGGPFQPGFTTAVTNNLEQMIVGLIIILAMIAGAAWLLRRYYPMRSSEGAIKVIGGLVLGTRERMVLVEVDGVRVLVGVAPGRLQTLHVFNLPAVDQSLTATAPETTGRES